MKTPTWFFLLGSSFSVVTDAFVSSCYKLIPRSDLCLHLNRRDLFQAVFWSTNTLLIADATPALAGSTQEAEDKKKILKGYERLNYLLDNWEKETTICKSGIDNPYIGCERNPAKVMEYMGYKSTNDPLFKADKTLLRLQPAVPKEYEGDYLEMVETWLDKAEAANGIAYVSSWGESNPGGGKDRVEYFIERAKKDVIAARDVLGQVIQILDIKAS